MGLSEEDLRKRIYTPGPAVQQKLMVNMNTPEGPKEVELEVGTFMLLDTIAATLQNIEVLLAGESRNEGEWWNTDEGINFHVKDSNGQVIASSNQGYEHASDAYDAMKRLGVPPKNIKKREATDG